MNQVVAVKVKLPVPNSPLDGRALSPLALSEIVTLSRVINWPANVSGTEAPLIAEMVVVAGDNGDELPVEFKEIEVSASTSGMV